MFKEKIYRLGRGVIEVGRTENICGCLQRGKQRKKTTEQAKKANERNRVRQLQRMLHANFKPGDFHVILAYKKGEEPETYGQAQKDVRRFLRGAREYYHDRGHTLKYIGCTERGKRKAVLHHHFIVECIDADNLHTVTALRKFWPGNCKWFDLYEEGDFGKLAEYLAKAAGKEEAHGARYYASRGNLIRPKPEVRIRPGRIPEEPEAPQGWYVVKDTLHTGTNPYNGKRYQRYLLKRLTTSKINENGKFVSASDNQRTGAKGWRGRICAGTRHGRSKPDANQHTPDQTAHGTVRGAASSVRGAGKAEATSKHAGLDGFRIRRGGGQRGVACPLDEMRMEKRKGAGGRKRGLLAKFVDFIRREGDRGR